MKKNSAELVTGTASAIFFAAVLGWLFSLSEFNNGFQSMELRILPLALLLVVEYYVNYILLKKGVNAAVFVLLQIALIAVGTLLLCRCWVVLEPRKTGTVTFLAAVFGTMQAAMAYFAYEPVKRNGLLLRFDLTVVMILIVLFAAEFRDLSALNCALTVCGIAMAAILLALITDQAGQASGASAVRGSRSLGPIMVAAVLAVVAGLTALTITLFAGGARAVSSALVGGGKTLLAWGGRGVRAIYGVMERVMQWLSRFVKEPDAADLVAMGGGGGTELSGEEILPRNWLPSWAGKAALLLVVAAVVVLLIRICGKTARRTLRTEQTENNPARRINGLSSALKTVFSRWRQKEMYYVDRIKLRNTAPGLLLRCERRVPKPLRRRAGESGEAFLRRLGECCGEPALATLADALERSFYARSGEAVSEELSREIKKIKFT